jgi:hypothetical protein
MLALACCQTRLILCLLSGVPEPWDDRGERPGRQDPAVLSVHENFQGQAQSTLINSRIKVVGCCGRSRAGV